MPYELFLALRYLRMRRGRRVARWTALAAVVARGILKRYGVKVSV